MEENKSQFGYWWEEMIKENLYPPETEFFEPLIKKIIANLNPRDKRLLDVGSGEGRFAEYAYKLGAEVDACDFDEYLSNLCCQSISSKICSAEKLNYPDNTYDIVMSNMVLMCIEDYSSAVSELYRVLKKGGTGIISILHPCFEWVLDKNNKYKITYNDYLNELNKEWIFKRKNNKKIVKYFHRPLSSYLNLICKFFEIQHNYELGYPNNDRAYAPIEYFIFIVRRK